MRSSVLFSAVFAATALASPVLDRRAEVVVTDHEIIYVTDVVTVTASSEPPAATPAAATTTTTSKGRGRYGKWWKTQTKYSQSTSATTTTTPAPAPETTPEAPAPTPYEAPAPALTTEAPDPEPTPEAPAPEPTTETPVPESTSSSAPAPSASEYAPAPSAPSTSVASTYQQAVLNHHNYHRANHSANDLLWSDSLAATALKIAKTCVYAHSMAVDGGNYGQNIAAGVSADKISTVISDMFYNGEINAYGGSYGSQPDMSDFSNWGHMSQIVWKSTTQVGCASYDCAAAGYQPDPVLKGYGGKFTVCNYSPPGNFNGEYNTQVGASLNQPTIDGTYNVDSSAIMSSYSP